MIMSGCDTKTNPRIQLFPVGDWYNLTEKPHNFTVWLLDPKLHNMLRQHECSTSRNAPNTTWKKNDHFAGYKMYNGCKDFSIYYKLYGDVDEDIRAGNLPANCSLIRLPIDTFAYDRDVFNMLQLFLHVPNSCSSMSRRA
ncbi:hypothetical protein EJD97_009153 [Solanum chilense]|uniref:Uncharacterized protein n=1 Tax=Solanum chilense TaxID=4083 RepID=A0A6N2AGC7_SOLCI|nr:hypothetical protein EJD97_009153 [Solanum chilense]